MQVPNSPNSSSPGSPGVTPRQATTNGESAPPVASQLALLYLRVSTSRQAHRGGEAEGYSLPAQRDACSRKASELGAFVGGEFVDAGASARSADRDGLQALLARLADASQPPIAFVIVHKLDRLARDRADDVALLLAIRNAGAQLVSVSEQIDETPAGMLLHGIMATMAEFYSRNLSSEAKKGIAEKAKRGGTIGYAPTGYLNSTTRVTDEQGISREAKTVIPDPARAEHISWAFLEYANGDVSISDLTVQLAARGLTTRDSRAVGKSLSRAAVHRMLSNPYYSGKVVHRGAIYPGTHQALVDEATFALVQDRLAGRKVAGNRAWRRDHYLKGSVVCARCGSRLGYSLNRGKGGEYAYFFCLGRAKHRPIQDGAGSGIPGTECDLPYLPEAAVEQAVVDLWYRQSLSTVQATDLKAIADESLAAMRASQSRELKAAEREVTRLTTTKQRLLDAYLAAAVSLEDFQGKQSQLGTQLLTAQERLNLLTRDIDRIDIRIDLVISLLLDGGVYYDKCPPEAKRLLNQALFTRIRVGYDPRETEGEASEAVAAVLGLKGEDDGERAVGDPDAQNDHQHASGTETRPEAHTATTGAHLRILRGRDTGETTRRDTRNPRPNKSSSGGSNLSYLAEEGRFELPLQVTPY
jgi:site-specific DNA recombinase